MTRKIRLGLTMGDPNGIGPEIIAKALSEQSLNSNWSPLVFGDLDVLRQVTKVLNLPCRFLPYDQANVQDGEIPVLDLTVKENRDWNPGNLCAWGGESAFQFLTTAIQWALKQDIDAIVTAPLCKEALHAAGHNFPGHTEMLSHFTNKATPIMMLTVDQFRAIHVTTHVALRDAIASLTPESILKVIEIGNDALKQMGIASPKFGIPGLNPHAGENGMFGTEEQHIIIPAIEAARKKGIQCEGPFPPDTIFLHHRDGRFDAVIALYHDQAHIPLKLLGIERGINVTLGLPVIRTSVDHGTAFDRAAKFNADPGSLLHALDLAYQMAKNSLNSTAGK